MQTQERALVPVLYSNSLSLTMVPFLMIFANEVEGVFTLVCLFVCLSVCLFVNNFLTTILVWE